MQAESIQATHRIGPLTKTGKSNARKYLPPNLGSTGNGNAKNVESDLRQTGSGNARKHAKRSAELSATGKSNGGDIMNRHDLTPEECELVDILEGVSDEGAAHLMEHARGLLQTHNKVVRFDDAKRARNLRKSMNKRR